MNSPNELAIICGNYVNAYSIAASLQAVGFRGRIVCLKEARSGRTLVDLLANVETWEMSLKTADEIIPFVADRTRPEDAKWIFFTDERFHETFRNEARDPRLANARFFVGSHGHLDTILDRHLFCQFIEDRGLGDVPRTVPGAGDPFAVFPEKFFLRAKRSWDGLKKTPRVKLVCNRRALDETLAKLRLAGYHEEDWCYQEALSVSPKDNVSICGWHGPEAKTYFATRKVLQHPPKVGNGDVCEIIEPPTGLMDVTLRLLNALEYCGPFELEFVLDTAAGAYKIIELNPRFWMQHGLLEAVTEHELVRRYVAWPIAPARAWRPTKYWVNTIYALFRIMRCDLRVLKYLGRRTTLFAPPWRTAMRWLPLFLPNLCRRLFL